MPGHRYLQTLKTGHPDWPWAASSERQAPSLLIQFCLSDPKNT